MTKPYMLTASGKHFDLLDPKPEQVDHRDIFASISKLCRFTGHCDETYTVGQHSLLVTSLVPAEFRLEALMHDAAEAYTGDVGTPMKVALATMGCTAFREIEHNIESRHPGEVRPAGEDCRPKSSTPTPWRSALRSAG